MIKKEIIANCTSDETRVAFLEDGKLSDIFIERPESTKIVRNVYKGKVEATLQGISSAFVNIGLEKNGYLHISDSVAGAPQIYADTVNQGIAKKHHIDKVLHKGLEIMVQVSKEAISTKGVKLTMNISLPGKYLVFMPFEDHMAISKSINNRKEKDRLRKILEGVCTENKGFIVRTEAEGATNEELKREVRYLYRLWKIILKKYNNSQAPALVHKDLGLTFQTVRDVLNEEINVFLIDSKKEHGDVLGFVDLIAPELKNKVRHYDSKTPIFTAFNVEEELEKIRHSRIKLPRGGTIIIQEAESLCAIDVNTGKFKGKESQEETIFETNKEAAIEIGRQLRLRNIGGIIVIDFIDMKNQKNRQRIYNILHEIVRHDKAKTKILPITRLGLIEMTRERKRESIVSYLGEICPECSGSGQVLSRESMFIKLKREILDLTKGRSYGKLRLALNPMVAEYVRQRQKRLENALKRSIQIQTEPTLKWEDYKIILE
ncbi:MAG: Rne/Rng family ribonuclease [bacterium]